MKRSRRSIDAADLKKEYLAAWLNELGFEVDHDEDGDLRFDISPFLWALLLIGEGMIELLIVERFQHLDESMGLILVNQLNGRRFTPKWLLREEGRVICAYRYDWQGKVSLSTFARVVRIFGATAARGYHWVEQADDSARRHKEEQTAADQDDRQDSKEATPAESAEAGAASNPSKTFH